MSKSYVMTLRLPEVLGLEVERAAARQGHKAAQLGASLIEEGIRRRQHPLMDLRQTSTGRVAYVNGTRLAVYWVVQQIQAGSSIEGFARDSGLTAAQVRAALVYAAAYPVEIEADAEQAREGLEWVQQQDTAARAGTPPKATLLGKGGK